MLYKNAKMDTFYAGDCAVDYPCEVALRESEIVVSYRDDDDRIVNYVGREMGAGHYELHSPETGDRATLHRFEKATKLDGFWIEGGYEGMWRIDISE